MNRFIAVARATWQAIGETRHRVRLILAKEERAERRAQERAEQRAAAYALAALPAQRNYQTEEITEGQALAMVRTGHVQASPQLRERAKSENAEPSDRGRGELPGIPAAAAADTGGQGGGGPEATAPAWRESEGLSAAAARQGGQP